MTKAKVIILAVAVLIYMIALPLCLYFIFYVAPARPDLPPQYVPEYGQSGAAMARDEIVAELGFVSMLEDSGFRLASVRGYGSRSALQTAEMTFTDEETYYITLRVCAVGCTLRDELCYERREIAGRAVGFITAGITDPDTSLARYLDDKTGRIYYISPFFDFDATEMRFIELLITLTLQ